MLFDKICISNFLLPPTGMGGKLKNSCDLPITGVNNIKEVEFIYNYPNPFNSITTISFGIPETASVSLKIFDIYGREVTTLVDETFNKGIYNYEWNTSDSNETRMVNGTYFYRLIYLWRFC